MNLVETLPIGKNAPKEINILVEIPRGSSNKYEYDPELGVIKLDRVLHSPFFYPVDYGFIPQTSSQDGDALDAMILTDNPVLPGVLIGARPIGLLLMKDEEGLDHKILAVPANNPHYNEYQELKDVPSHIVEEIGHFFSEYKRLEGGKWAKVEGWQGKNRALRLIKKAHEEFKLKIKQKSKPQQRLKEAQN